ncbi:MAG: PA2169 family four-helix-bundle protein [Planctomycetota bacterium]
MEAKTALNKETLDRIQDLIEINNDSAAGFEKAADLVSAPIDDKLRRFGQERRELASELSALAALSGDRVRSDGSWQGRVHRWWLHLRANIQPNRQAAVLAEVERGEASICEAYEDTLRSSPGSAISDMLHRQLAAIRLAKKQVRQLRSASR